MYAAIGGKHEMGGHRFKMWGSGITGTPLATALMQECLTSFFAGFRRLFYLSFSLVEEHCDKTVLPIQYSAKFI